MVDQQLVDTFQHLIEGLIGPALRKNESLEISNGVLVPAKATLVFRCRQKLLDR